ERRRRVRPALAAVCADGRDAAGAGHVCGRTVRHRWPGGRRALQYEDARIRGRNPGWNSRSLRVARPTTVNSAGGWPQLPDGRRGAGLVQGREDPDVTTAVALTLA